MIERGSTFAADDSQAPERARRQLPFALSFVDGEGLLVLRDLSDPPIRIHRLELLIAGLTFPFNLTGGPDRLRDRWLQTRDLEITVALDELRRLVAELPSEREGLSDLALGFHRGAPELVGRLANAPSTPWFILRYEPDVIDEHDLIWRPSLFVLLGPPVVSFPEVAAAIGRLAEPGLRGRGLDVIAADAPRRVLRRTLLAAGYRLPDCRGLKLHTIDLTGSALSLGFSTLRPLPALTSSAAMALGEIEPLLRPGDEAAARGELDRARRIYLGALGQEPGHPSIVTRLGWLDAVDPSRRVSARAACRRARDTGESGEHPSIRALRASLDLAAGDAEAAIPQLESLVEHLGPLARSRLLAFLGRLTARIDPSRAMLMLEAALSHDPEQVDALEALRDCCAEAGRRRELEWTGARLVAAQTTSRDRAATLTDLGRIFRDQFGDIPRAAKHYEDALLYRPDSAEALFGLAECHAARGAHRSALRSVEAAATQAAQRGDRDLEVRAHLRAGELWEEMNDPAAAAARFHHALTIDPSSRPALERAARADIALGRYDKAAADLGRLADLATADDDPEHLRRALTELAQLYLDRLHVPSAARAAIDRLRAAFPGDPAIRELAQRVGEPDRSPGPSVPLRPEETEPAAPQESSPADLDAALEAFLASPDDEALAGRLVAQLEAAGDWPRLVAVLAARIENTEPQRQPDLLVQMARALSEGLDDRQSAADSLLRAAELAPPRQGAEHARRAADLLSEAGMDDEAAEAEELAEQLDELAETDR